jgi:hypothetical protein
VASDSAELLLAPQQRTGTPTWGHRATSPALDPATERLGLAKAALNQVGRRQITYPIFRTFGWGWTGVLQGSDSRTKTKET